MTAAEVQVTLTNEGHGFHRVSNGDPAGDWVVQPRAGGKLVAFREQGEPDRAETVRHPFDDELAAVAFAVRQLLTESGLPVKETAERLLAELHGAAS